MKYRVLALVFVVVLAGCGTGPTGPETDTSTRSSTPTDSVVQTTDPTSQRTPTPTTTRPQTTPESTSTTSEGSEAIESPFGSETIVVAVDNRADPDRNIERLVADVIAFWEGEARQYAKYPANFTLAPNSSDPDVVVEFTGTVSDCPSENITLGCAPILTPDVTVEEQPTIQIRSGYDDESTVEILKHEFGHLLGIRHGEEPKQVMAAFYDATRASEPNATERPIHFRDDELDVYINLEGIAVGERGRVRDQVGHAIDYYNSNPEGTPDNLSFRVVDEESAADIVVVPVFGRNLCSDNQDACAGGIYGFDVDDDPALEFWINGTISMNVDGDEIGWYTARWLGILTYTADGEELPPVLTDPSVADEEWWKE